MRLPAAISGFDPSWFCRFWMAESCGASSSYFLPLPAPSVNLTCRRCNRSAARFLPRCVKPSKADPRRWVWKHFPSRRQLDPVEPQTVRARSLAVESARSRRNGSQGLPHRCADGGSSGAGCAPGLDGGPRGLEMAVNRAPVQIPMTPEEAQATRCRYSSCSSGSASPGGTSGSCVPAVSKPVRQSAAKPVLKPKTRKPPSRSNSTAAWWCTNMARSFFGWGHQKRKSPPKADPGVVASDAIQQAATREDDGSVTPAPTSPPSANGYLLERVEPQYPEAARQQHIQGPVVLNVLVGATVRFGKPA